MVREELVYDALGYNFWKTAREIRDELYSQGLIKKSFWSRVRGKSWGIYGICLGLSKLEVKGFVERRHRASQNELLRENDIRINEYRKNPNKIRRNDDDDGISIPRNLAFG